MTTNPYDAIHKQSVAGTVQMLRNSQLAIGWALEHLPHLHLWDFFNEWKEDDEATWATNMAKWAAYAYDSKRVTKPEQPNFKRTTAPALPDFEPHARWALEAIDAGRIDHSELHDFAKDWLEGNDLGAWYREDAARRALAKDIAGQSPE
jgi:hypothetical protein